MWFRWLDNLLQRPGAYASTFQLLRDLGMLALILGAWTWVVQTITAIHSLGVGVWLVFALLLTAVTVVTLLGIKALQESDHSSIGTPHWRWPNWESRERFAAIDTFTPWREVRDADRQMVGMKYSARVSFNRSVESAKIRLSFFEEVHLMAGGAVTCPISSDHG